ncbi:hypothetical protein DFR29_106271 [Tahibacter aquaticus]|uniref:Ig-like domain-containing protein n=1 Tax=Tahibacter aquaticus TaxID=520092 RepID=A0A4R6YZ55_9GAMM|nr:hypothetical protein [Tahibacter aquaticus]TDR44123.1 hypothetical protein DFR29_106271 [Tahibacter aquaticus]
MFRSFCSFASSAVVIAACLSSATAHADKFCETIPLNLCNTTECYTSTSQSLTDADCTDSVYVLTTQSIGTAPANTSLQCSRASSGHGYTCEAWPQGEEISYDWFNSNNSAIATDVINPFRSFNCNAGTISVAVVGPGGGTSLASATLPSCN